MFYDEESRKFARSGSHGRFPRSFVHFILEPFYKVVSVSISEEKAELEPILGRLGVYLKKKEFGLDIKPLVKLVLRNLLGDMSCFVDTLVGNFPNTRSGTRVKVERNYQNVSDNVDL